MMHSTPEKLPTIFYDRRGKIVSPTPQSVIKPRRGVFALVLSPKNAIALVWPQFTNGIPDLPGGGIEEGESLDEALHREWMEETGLPFNLAGPIGKEFHHIRGFYADDRDEFWIYDQTFRLYRCPDDVTTGVKWPNPEGDYASWENIDSLPQLPVNRAHWCSIPFLLSQANIRIDDE